MDQDRRPDHRPHLPLLLTHLRTGALASGGVGTFAVQIARHPGAQVPGVCSTPDVDVVRQLGAGHVIDYTKQDFTLGAAARYDLAFRRDSTASAAARRLRRPRTRPPGSGSSGDGNVGGPKIKIASELAGLFPAGRSTLVLAPRFRDAENWSQGPAEAHRMATGPPLGRGEDAESIEGNRFISPTHTGGA
jgi:hypothetical protein